MTAIDPEERKILTDLVVRYYDTLTQIAIFLDKGAHGAFPYLKDKDFIEIEQCLYIMEGSIDTITLYIKEGCSATPSQEDRDKLTDSLQDIYAALNTYKDIGRRIEHQQPPPAT